MGRLSLAVLLVAAAASVAAAPPLLQNVRFNPGSDGIPAGWRVEAWNRELTDVTVEPPVDGRTDSAGVVRIMNRGPNDARLCQSIPVTAGVSYLVAARVKTENVGLQTAGALIALEPRIADSVDLKGTQDWQALEVTAMNPDHNSWDVCLRLGSYANLNTGTAWFTDVQVEAVGGNAPASESHWPSFSLTPLLVSFRQTPWVQTAVPLLAGLLLAFGLGIVGRGRR